jgi:hypothetical protein
MGTGFALCAALLGAATVGLSCAADAAVTLRIVQAGADVIGTGTGSIDTVLGTFPAGGSEIGLGTLGSVSVDGFTATLSGSPTTFGAGGFFSANSGSGQRFSITPGSIIAQIFLPVGYVSGSSFSDSAEWSHTTIAGLGLTPGVYTYGFGSGASADSITLDIGVPEPAAWTLLLVGFGGLGAALRLRRPAAASIT